MQVYDPTEDVADRAQQFSPDFVRAFPHATASLVSGVVDPGHLGDIAKGLSLTLPWLLTNTRANGLPGGALASYQATNALLPRNAQLRRVVKDSLWNQRLPTPVLSPLETSLRSTFEGTEGGVQTAGIPFGQQAAYQQAFYGTLADLARHYQTLKDAIAQNHPGSGTDDHDLPKWLQAATPEQLDQIKAISAQYSQIVDPLANAGDPLFLRFMSNGFAALGGVGQSLVDLAQLHFGKAGMDLSGSAASALTTINQGGQLIGEGFSAGARAAGGVLSHVGITEHANLQGITSTLFWGPSQAFRGVNDIASSLSRGITSTIGIKPGDPGYNAISGTITFGITAELLKGIAGASRALSTAAHAPRPIEIGADVADQARDEAGIMPSRTILGRQLPRGTEQALIQQFGGPVFGRINKVLYDLASKPADEWIRNSTVGKLMLRRMLNIKKTTPLSQVPGKLITTFTDLTSREALDIANATDREEVARVLERRFSKVDWQRIDTVNKSIRRVQQLLRQKPERPTMGSEGFVSAEVEEQPFRSAIQVSRAETLQQYPRGSGEIQRVPALGGLYERTFGPEEANTLFQELNKLSRPDALQRLEEVIPPEAEQAFIQEMLSPKKALESVAPPSLDPLTEANLKTDLLRYQDELSRLKPSEVAWSVPQTSFLTRMIRQAPGNAFEERMASLFNPRSILGLKKLPVFRLGEDGKLHWASRRVRLSSLSRALDDIGDTRLWNPAIFGGPPDALTRNAELIIRAGQRVGLESTTVQSLLSVMSRVKTAEDFYNFSAQLADSIGRSAFVAPDVAAELSSIIRKQRVETESNYGFVGGQAILEDANTGNALPTQANELLDHITLPSLGRMIEATSWSREFSRNLRERGGAARVLLLPTDFIKGLVGVSTAILKPLILVSRELGALPLRIQGEQWARNYFAGYKGIVRRKGLGLHDADVLNAIGNLNRQLTRPVGDFHEVYRPIATDNLRPGQPIPQAVSYGILRRLHMFSTDDGMRVLSHGPRVFADWLRGEGAAYLETMQPILNRSGASVSDWIARKWQEMQEVTGGNERLLEAIDGAVWRPEPSAVPTVARGKGFGAVSPDLQRLEADYNQARTRLREELNADAPSRGVLRGLSQQIRDILKEEDRLTKFRQGSLSIDLMADEQRFNRILQREFDSGRYAMPDRVIGVADERNRFPGKLDSAEKLRDQFANFLYKGLAPLSKVDVAGTRGSYFAQVFRARFDELIARGYRSGEARDVAEWRAARETANHLYDLGARNSMHAFFKDTFWFLPATQEILNTWFNRLPKAYAGNVLSGLVLGGAQVMNLVNAAHKTGLLKKDPNGNDVINLPGPMATGLALIAGLPTEGPNKNIIYGYGQSLNLISSGATFGLPSLSPLPGVALKWLAKNYGGVFKALGDKLIVPGIPQTLAPSVFNYAWEWRTGTAPPWEILGGNALKAQTARAFNDAFAMSYYDLEQRGKLPPQVPKNATGAQLEAAHAAMDDYLKELQQNTERIYKGRAFVGLIGAAFFPFSLHTTTEYRREITKIFQKVYKNGALSETGRQRLDDWVSEHPGSLPYTLSLTRLNTDQPVPNLTSLSEQDPNWFKQQYQAELDQGIRIGIPPEEFAKRIVALQEFHVVTGLIDQGLHDISPTLDLGEILQNHGQYSQVMQQAWDEYDRWSRANPEETAILKDQLLSRAGQYGQKDFPIQSVQAQRAHEAFKIFTSFAEKWTTDGIRDADYKRFRAQIGNLWAESAIFGAPRTDLEKGLQFYGNRIQPYFDHVNGLYLEAHDLANRRESTAAAALYDEARQFSDQAKWKNITYKGERLPSPEAFLYSSLDPSEQFVKRAHWMSVPPEWLTKFQAKTIGYDVKLSPMWDAITKANQQIEQVALQIGKQTYDPRVKELEAAEGAAIAQNYGSEGTQAFSLSQLAPYARMTSVSQNQTWQQMVQTATAVTQGVTAAGFSPKGVADGVATLKTQFFAQIDAATTQGSSTYDPKFSRLMDRLGFAMADHGEPRAGDALYDALFFGQFTFPFVASEAPAA